ncbi:secretin N-terminal domain-containing protein [Verrucomicrobiota bacterium]
MKQNKRKVSLGLVAMAVGLGATSILGAVGSQEDNTSFSANVDAAIADIEKLLADPANPSAEETSSEKPEAAEESPVNQTAPIVTNAIPELTEPEAVSVVPEKSVPTEKPVSITLPVVALAVEEEVVASVAVSEEEEALAETVPLAQAPVVEESVPEVASAEAEVVTVDEAEASALPETSEENPVPVEAEEASVEEMVAAAQEEIANELAEVPAEEEKVAQQAVEEFSGFEPLKQVVPAAVEVVAEEVVVPEEVVADTVELAAQAEVVPSDRISVQLDKAGLEETINLFSQLSGVNIIIPRLDKEETVTVNLSDVEWKPALQSVLDSYNLELYQKVPSVEIYTIRDKPVDAPEPLELRTFRLNYATVTEVEELVKSMLADGSQVSKFPSRNMISVRSTAAAIEEIDQLITAIDMPRQQVFIEAKFLELSDSAQEDLGIDWKVLQGYNVSATSITRSITDGVTKTDSSRVLRDIDGTYVPEFDQVITVGTNATALSKAPFVAETDDSFSRISSAVLGASDFQLVLSALKENEGVSVVSNPKIIVANEETASIHIGQKKPNIKGTTTVVGDSGTPIVTYALDGNEPYFTDGIKVDVTPTVNTENNISVKIEPTLERLDASATLAGDGTKFYGKTTKAINTVFSLQSGQTAAIGGLTEVTESDVERKIPVLGSIPLLGRLFTYSSEYKNQTETIIFVTLGLANPGSISFETGLPEDAQLARRRMIRRRYEQPVFQAENGLYDAGQRDEQERKLKQLEQTRIALEKMRAEKAAKEAEKAAKAAAKAAEASKDAAESEKSEVAVESETA